ncbi:MAG: MarR family winged helix-turn-helix transcriptional regulator [Pseudorhodoplanes sp.]
MLSRTKTKPVTRPTAKSSHYVLDEQVGFLLRLAMQRHTSIFMSQMTAKLTQTQFAALAKLLEVGPCSQNHLGRLIYLDAATIKGVVDRLKLRKFITTQSDPGDRRRRAITLTEQGRAATRQAIEIAGNITATTMVPLSAEEQRTIVRLLKKLT